MSLPQALNLKKIILIFSFSLLFLILPSSVFSKEEIPYYDLSPEAYREAVEEPPPEEINAERIGRHETIKKLYDATSLMMCWPKKECQADGLSSLGKMIATLYNHPPASSVYYLAYLGENLGLVEKAYAQGLGFPGLSPILDLWKVFRNLAYLVLVVIMVVLGFMIMFRTKINPQTVISIQNALPRIIVTLLLITFSYAIAGLLIDLMYLSILLVISIFAQSGMINRPETVQEYYMTGGLPNLFGAVFSSGFRSLDNFFKAIGLVPAGIAELLTAIAASGTVGSLLGMVLLPGIVMFIIALALLFTFIRIFLILLTSYVQVILLVVFGPIQILMDALPGRNSFLSWLLGLIGNLVVFPATAAVLLIATILTTHDITKELWQPPLIGGAAGGTAIIAFIGLGMVIITPSLVNKIKAAFQPKPTIPISPMAPLMPILGGAQAALSTGMQFYYLTSTINALIGTPEQPGILRRLLGKGGQAGED